MPEINVVVVTGNLVADPELVELPSGAAKMSARIAVDEARKAGEENGKPVWETRTNFFDVEMFGARAESRARGLSKGAKVAVKGRLRYDQWEDRNDGGKRSKVLISAEEITPLFARPKAAGAERELTREEVDAQFAAIPRSITPDYEGWR